MEYILYCDESEKRGALFSNFYGGALIRSIHLHEVAIGLESYKHHNGINGEMKWTKVTEQYLDRYIGFIDKYFDYVKQDKIKLRVMFQQNEFAEPRIRNLTKEQRDDSYFLLYYQFFKHAFGLRYSNLTDQDIYLKIFFDQFPDTREKVDRFKDYIHRLQYQDIFLNARLKIRYEDIIEMTSHDHVIAQGMDIVTGAMYFRLNKLHLHKEPGMRIRGKRTRAKEKLYNRINDHIREIYPNFNIGITTGFQSNRVSIWEHSYRHWCFLPNQT
jgi:hypothetical protein